MIKADTMLAQLAANVVSDKLAEATAMGATTPMPLIAEAPPGGVWFQLSLRGDGTTVAVQVSDCARLYFSGAGRCIITVSTSVMREHHNAVGLVPLEHQLNQVRTAAIIPLH